MSSVRILNWDLIYRCFSTSSTRECNVDFLNDLATGSKICFIRIVYFDPENILECLIASVDRIFENLCYYLSRYII